MSDREMEIKARLVAEDDASPQVKRLISQIEALKKKMTDLGKARIQGDLVDPKLTRYFGNMGKEVNLLTPKYLRLARAMQSFGQLTETAYRRASREVEYFADKVERGERLTKRDMATAQKAMKMKAAMGYVWNQVADKKIQAEGRYHSALDKLEGQAEARRQRREREAEREEVQRQRRRMRDLRYAAGTPGRMMNRLDGNGLFNSPTFYTMAAGAAAAKATQSSISTRMRIENAETSARMFGGMSAAQVAEMRKGFGNEAAIKYGVDPAKMIEAYTEVLKAGISDKDGLAQAITDQILKSATGLDVSVEETTKMVGRAASLSGEISPAKIASMLNAVAIANRESAADGNEIIAANRRGTGVLATSKMTMEQLSAFTAGGISGGMQSAKAGTFMGFIVNDLVNAGKARGQRGQDLSRASQALGFGNRQAMASRMAADPAEALQQVLERLANMNEQKRAEVANLLGMREWRDELSIMVQERQKIRQILDSIADPKNANNLEEVSQLRRGSLQGRWNSMKSAITIVWETIGSGFDDVFKEIAGFLTEFASKIDKGMLKSHVEVIVNGIREGFGYKTWAEAMTSIFGAPGSTTGSVDKFFKFAKGFASGIKYVAEVIGGVFVAAAKAFGVDAADPEAMGRFVAQVMGFTVALHFLRPVLSVFGLFIDLIKGLVAVFVSIPQATIVALGGLLASIQDWGVKARSPNEARQQREDRRAKKMSYLDEPEEAGRLFHRAAFETTDGGFKGLVHRAGLVQSLDGLRDQLSRSGGGVQLASLGGSSGGFRTGGGGGAPAGFGGLSSGGGTANSLLNAVPGQKLGDFGAGSGIISRGSVGSSPMGGSRSIGSGSSGGAGPSVSSVPGRGETGREAAVLDMIAKREGVSGEAGYDMIFGDLPGRPGTSKYAGVLGGRKLTDMSVADVIKMQPKLTRATRLNGVGRGLGTSAVGSGQFIRSTLMQNLQQLGIPKSEWGNIKFDRDLQRRLTLNNFRKYVGDPNNPASWNRTGLMNQWESFDTRKGYKSLTADELNKVNSASPDKAIGKVPSASDAISNVPAGGAAGAAGLVPMTMNNGATININGGNQDPETLANLVQRRFDESVNWRTHDVEHEMS